jgi:Ion channel
LLFTIALWFAAFVFGYALALWAFAEDLGGHAPSFGDAAFVAASMLFTLGFSDAVPHGATGRALAIAAGGTGFASLALLVAYLPTLYQAFSRRETYISQLDARAGSPPAAGELLARDAGEGSDDLGPFLLAWEGWSADLLESLLSFPTLGFYRSHHDNQSWLAALACMLDTCSLVLVSGQRRVHRQAKLTYAMCRHAAVDLARALYASPTRDVDRLDASEFERLRDRLADTPWHLPDDAESKLTKLRAGYEPYVAGLARRLLMPLPNWTAADDALDSWQLTRIVEAPRRASRRSR